MSRPMPAPSPAPDPQPTIPLAVPDLSGNEEAYLAECVRTGWVSSAGPFVARFETMVASAAGVSHAVATSSGTAALQVALRLVGVGRDEEVVTSSLSFVASANAIRHVGAHPVFVDADPATWQMDPAVLARFLDQRCAVQGGAVVNRGTGRVVAAILPVHLLGNPVDLDAISGVATDFGLPIVEDAAEAVGARYKGRPVGSIGGVGCYSFNGNKVATCGGGGAILTNRAGLAVRARHLITQARRDPVESVHDEVGYNYRMTSLQAAVGCAQLERLDTLVAAKQRIARRYRDALAGVPGLTFMPEPAAAESSYWLSTIIVDEGSFGMDRRSLALRLADGGIETRPLWQPLHKSPAHAGSEACGGGVAERLQRDCLSLPSSTSLSQADQQRVIDAILAVARSAPGAAAGGFR